MIKNIQVIKQQYEESFTNKKKSKMSTIKNRKIYNFEMIY